MLAISASLTLLFWDFPALFRDLVNGLLPAIVATPPCNVFWIRVLVLALLIVSIEKA